MVSLQNRVGISWRCQGRRFHRQWYAVWRKIAEEDAGSGFANRRWDQGPQQEEKEHKDVIHVKFKDFVINFDKENLRICKFLGIKSKFKFKKNNRLFDLRVSRKNLTKYTNYLSKYENNLIQKKLKKFLQR